MSTLQYTYIVLFIFCLICSTPVMALYSPGQPIDSYGNPLEDYLTYAAGWAWTAYLHSGPGYAEYMSSIDEDDIIETVYLGSSWPHTPSWIVADGTYAVDWERYHWNDDEFEYDYFVGSGIYYITVGPLGPLGSHADLSLSAFPSPINVTQPYKAQLSGDLDYTKLIQISYYGYKLESDNVTIDNSYTEDYTIYSRSTPVGAGDTDWNMYRKYNNGDSISGIVNSSDLYEAEFYPYEAGYYYLKCTLGYDTDDDEIVDDTEDFDCYQYVYGVYFTASPTSGNAPLTVSFTDYSVINNESVTAWVWEFGDGYTSYAQNPIHTYTTSGDYSPVLTVYTGSSGYSGMGSVYVSAANPIANFTAAPTSGNAPLTVSFTDASDNATAWYWEFGDGYTSSAENPSHTYVSAGDYSVILTAYNAYGSDTETKIDYINVESEIVTSNAIIYGYTHDGTNLIDGVTVAISNNTWSSSNTSYGGGYYKFADLAPGTYSIKGSKNGYITSPEYSITAYESTSVEQDVTLGISGVAVTGTCYNAATGLVLEDVTVTLTQSGTSYTDESSAAGLYTINDMSSGSAITVNAALAGYTYSSWSFIPEDEAVYEYDLYLMPSTIGTGTTIYGLVYNADDEQAITGSTVTITNGTWTTTNTTISTGFYLIDSIPAAGSYSVSAIASGYDNSTIYSVSAIDNSSVQQDIPLDSSVSSDQYSDYVPHLVRFLCVDEYNRPLTNVEITAAYQQSSGPVDWIYSVLGLSKEADIESQTLTGTTGIDGSIVFLMVETIKYDITVTASDLGLSKSFQIYPKEDEITVRFYLNPLVNLSAMPEYELTAVDINSTYVALGLFYYDSTTDTNSLLFKVSNYQTGDLLYSRSFTNSSLPGWLNASYNVENVNGTMYQWGFEADHIEYGNISAYKGVTMKGATGRIVDFGLEDESLYQWMAIIFIFLFAGAFSGVNVKQGAVLVPLFGGGFFWYIGWLPISLGIVISSFGFIGVLVYMRKSEWKVRT